jgi:hypothetical protein
LLKNGGDVPEDTSKILICDIHKPKRREHANGERYAQEQTPFVIEQEVTILHCKAPTLNPEAELCVRLLEKASNQALSKAQPRAHKTVGVGRKQDSMSPERSPQVVDRRDADNPLDPR